jgi:peptidyl-tRNA hydrolase
VSDWVLSNFTQDEKNIIEMEIEKKVKDSIIKWL